MDLKRFEITAMVVETLARRGLFTRRWPTIYLIDQNGIVRDRDVRQEKSVERVQQMTREMKERRADAEESG